MVRRIVLEGNDPRIKVLRQRVAELERNGMDPGVASVNVKRKYSRAELAKAELLHLLISAVFEPCGEDMGTVYDDTRTCSKCGAGRVQRSPLRLNLNRVPKGVDIARTITWAEWIVSERLAEIFQAERVSGYELRQVGHRGRRRRGPRWFQLVVTGSAGATVPPTRFGKDYLREDFEERFVCRTHGLSGLNVVSELYLSRNALDRKDICLTENRYGIWGAGHMPVRMILLSPRFYGLLTGHGMKGYRVEVAHIAD